MHVLNRIMDHRADLVAQIGRKSLRRVRLLRGKAEMMEGQAVFAGKSERRSRAGS
jgi:hypothetical protein